MRKSFVQSIMKFKILKLKRKRSFLFSTLKENPLVSESVDKWKSKTMFLTFYICSSVVLTFSIATYPVCIQYFINYIMFMFFKCFFNL